MRLKVDEFCFHKDRRMLEKFEIPYLSSFFPISFYPF
ncbi:hypothetical protein SLEP1_g21011 [Rubroshorea leprosula]|uniref:Uncharacterized protein n=1 Tax=Rubroshorea leprosula TaxID=152421 RepID=A0AAV5JF83_9ROSI|nr:hypothetical protein SLEP1_g21011 [Rubroshorea leprosula]